MGGQAVIRLYTLKALVGFVLANHGSYALTWQGYKPERFAIQTLCSHVAQEDVGGREGAHLQVCQEGPHAQQDRCRAPRPVWRGAGAVRDWKQDPPHPQSQGFGSPDPGRPVLSHQKKPSPSASTWSVTAKTWTASFASSWWRAASTGSLATTRPRKCFLPTGSTSHLRRPLLSRSAVYGSLT